jgi:hypothetical protein
LSVLERGASSIQEKSSLLLARLGPKVAGKACLFCPSISDINLLGYGECIVYLDAKVTHRAFDFGVSQQQLDRA